jgi:hypothetical protein
MRMSIQLAALGLVVASTGTSAQSPVQAVFAQCPTGLPLFTEVAVQGASLSTRPGE